MIPGLEEHRASCPYCGEPITLVVDRSVDMQTYTEDCSVCCRPVVVVASEDSDGNLQLAVQSEDDA
ncbi:CPXCG motif-containing cysteine-rich protein [Microbulbifer sp.]|uniref:CPXCG motif-containing cysteine-rich protein n=1 Tax=Microbulbifer sp. TaxID=1908541 RepID=UPI003F36A135